MQKKDQLLYFLKLNRTLMISSSQNSSQITGQTVLSSRIRLVHKIETIGLTYLHSKTKLPF